MFDKSLSICVTLPALAAAFIATPLLAEPVPAEHLAAVEWAQRRGAELMVLDRAAWLATDDFEDHVRKSKRKPVDGYIVIDAADFHRVLWVGGTGAEARAYFETDVNPASTEVYRTREINGGRVLDEFETRMWRARELAVAKPFEACRPGYNTVVLPVGMLGAEGFDVYLLAPVMKKGEVVLGKHYKFHVDRDASVVESQREFSRSCIAGELPPNAVMWGGTHLLDPTPTEIHVFVSLQIAVDLSVVTTQNSLRWTVSKGTVAFNGSIGGRR